MHCAVIHGDEAVAGGPQGEDGDRDEGAIAGSIACDVLGGGELVEFLVADHAVEDVAWWWIARKLRSIPSSSTSPVYSAFVRSVSP